MLPRDSVQMCFADLPYGKKTKCDWDIDFNLAQLFTCLKNQGFANGNVIATATQPFTTRLITCMPNLFKYTLVWDKRVTGSPAVAKYRPLPFHEDIVVFRGKHAIYNPQMTKQPRAGVFMTERQNKCQSLSAHLGKPNSAFLGKHYTEKFPTSIIAAASRGGPLKDRGKHPTQKPVALLDWLIRTYSNPGDTVLDPVSGSNTTGVSAMLNGRSCVTIEKDEGYFEAGVERVQKAIRDNGVDAKVEVRR